MQTNTRKYTKVLKIFTTLFPRRNFLEKREVVATESHSILRAVPTLPGYNDDNSDIIDDIYGDTSNVFQSNLHLQLARLACLMETGNCDNDDDLYGDDDDDTDNDDDIQGDDDDNSDIADDIYGDDDENFDNDDDIY